MRKFIVLALTAVMALGALASAEAATEVKMTGDARVYGLFMDNRNFTGWSHSGTKKEENFEIWQRFRLRTDFVASEAVKFRFGIKVEDTWGHGTLTAANPTSGVSGGRYGSNNSGVQVYLAYLQFKWPDSDVQVTAGLQPLALPHSAMFNASPVFSDQAAALVITAPIIPDTLSVMTGFARLIQNTSDFTSTAGAYNATPVSDHRTDAQNLDAYILALPVTVDGFKVTPWGMIAVAGRDVAYGWKASTDSGTDLGWTFGDGLATSAAYQGASWKNNQNAFYWVGGAFEVTALDPVRFYADVIYGAGAMADRKANKRHGWFIDFGAEYTGLDVVTPQVFAWWSTGEDKSTSNGSERMPMTRSAWGPGGSFLFDNNQELNHGGANMFVAPVGNMGIGASLAKISFIEKLTHRLTFTYVRGTNSPQAIRNYMVAINGVAPNGDYYFAMGRDLTWNESLYAINFDTKYQIYENLAAVVETGWAHGDFQRHVWTGHHTTADAWKCAFGLTYKF